MGSARGELGWTAMLALLAACVVVLGAGTARFPTGASMRDYVALAGGAAATIVPLAIGLRSLRQSTRAARRGIGVVLFGGWIALGPLAVLGALMKANTHHHPLAAAAYAVLALGVTIGALAGAGRLTALACSDDLPSTARRTARAAIIGTAAIATVVAVEAFRRSAADPMVRRVLVDAMLLAGASAAAARVGPLRRPPAVIPLLVWAAVVIAGAQALSDPGVSALLADRAPLLLGPLWMFV